MATPGAEAMVLRSCFVSLSFVSLSLAKDDETKKHKERTGALLFSRVLVRLALIVVITEYRSSAKNKEDKSEL
jgi:hypothetical protein